FPVLMTIKLSVPLLSAPVLLLALRPRSLMNWACLAAVVLTLFSITWHVQIGIRIVLPIVALGAVGTAAGIVEAWRTETTDASADRPTWRKRVLAAWAGGGVLWTAAAALIVWPNGLCYVNELWGGTKSGYVRVSDANYDWGQGLPELARWQEQHGAARLAVW